MAIAFDATSISSLTTGISITWSHTVTGTNTMVCAGIASGGSNFDIFSGVTYNGSAMSLAGTGKIQVPSDAFIYLFYLLAPTTGANNFVASGTAFSSAFGYGTSYTGVKQSAQPDASNTNSNTASSSGITTSVTVVASGSWLVAMSGARNYTMNAGTGQTKRQYDGNTGGIASMLGDSNGAPGTGSQSMTTTDTSTSNFGMVMASFAPAAGASGPANIKTWDGVTQSTGVKTYMGVALASTKTFNGVT